MASTSSVFFGGASGVLCVVMGLPGAGKSSLAREMVASAASKELGVFACVSEEAESCRKKRVEWVRFDDDLEAAVREEAVFSEAAWRVSRSLAFDRVKSALTRACVVVADDNAYYRSMRHSLLKLARESDSAFCSIFIDVPLEEAQLRNGNRAGSERVPTETVAKMASLFERPEPAAHAWEAHSLIATAPHVDDAWAIIDRAFCAGPPPKPLSELELECLEVERARKRTETKANVAHNLDLSLRRLIGDLLKDPRCFNRKEMAKVLNGARKRTQNQQKRALAQDLQAALGLFHDTVLELSSSSAQSSNFKDDDDTKRDPPTLTLAQLLQEHILLISC